MINARWFAQVACLLPSVALCDAYRCGNEFTDDAIRGKQAGCEVFQLSQPSVVGTTQPASVRKNNSQQAPSPVVIRDQEALFRRQQGLIVALERAEIRLDA